MERALRHEIAQAIPELAGAIYPTNAPETSEKPYMVYMRAATGLAKTLDGYTGGRALRFVFSVMAARYEDVKALRDKLEGLLVALEKRDIGGEGGTYFIDEIEIHNIEETYEFELKANRGIIDFTVYY